MSLDLKAKRDALRQRLEALKKKQLPASSGQPPPARPSSFSDNDNDSRIRAALAAHAAHSSKDLQMSTFGDDDEDLDEMYGDDSDDDAIPQPSQVKKVAPEHVKTPRGATPVIPNEKKSKALKPQNILKPKK